MPILTVMRLIPQIGAVLLSLILAAFFMGCPVPRHTEVLTGPYPDSADRINPAPISTSRIQTLSLNLPMRFEANQGQFDPQVNFISRGSGYTLFLTPAEAVMVLVGNDRPDGLKDRPSALKSGNKVSSRIAERSFSVLRMKLVGANPSAKAEGLEELSGKTNYFIGDPSQWRTRVPSYKKVEYGDIYPGIHLIYYGNQRQLEYDFVVAPGANPELITLSFEGGEKLRIDENGDLVVEMAEGEEIRFHNPQIYQEMNGVRRPIRGRYSITPHSSPLTPHSQLVGFKVAAYDGKSPLVIDPTLNYSTYLGGTSSDIGYGLAVDSAGSAYVTGFTSSTGFPTTYGAYTTKRVSASGDAFVTKLATDGKSLVYSTYLGGTAEDRGLSIAVDSSGFAYVTGYTFSSNFPTTVGAYRTKSSTSPDVFVSQFTGMPTVVKLGSFTAMGEGGRVKVEWVTKTEIDNRGFNLYRSTQKEGTYIKLNPEIIPGLLSSAGGRAYTFYDDGLNRGQLYYYKLEDIDLAGKKTLHGPVCVDWNGNGVPDDVDPNRNVYSSVEAGKAGGSGSSLSGSGHGSSGGSGNFILPGFAGGTGSTVTKILLRDLRALKTDQGVLVEWRTGFEVNNLGFHVYRQEGNQLAKLTPELIAGSAFLSGAGTTTAGFSYSWLDQSAISNQQSAVRSPPPSPSPLEGEGRGGGAVAGPRSAVAARERESARR